MLRLKQVPVEKFLAEADGCIAHLRLGWELTLAGKIYQITTAIHCLCVQYGKISFPKNHSVRLIKRVKHGNYSRRTYRPFQIRYT